MKYFYFTDLHFLEEINRKIENANREKRNYGHLFHKPIVSISRSNTLYDYYKIL